MPDQVAQRYELIAPPIKGGMSEVVHAKDLVTGLNVALKMPRLDKDPYISRVSFDTELKVLSRVTGRHVIKCQGTDRMPDGRDFMILEWLPTGLRDLLDRQGRMTWRQFLDDVGNPLLQGLRVLHSAQIAHRDLSPNNIRFAPDGTLRITDLGISRRHDRSILDPTFDQAGSQPYTPPEADDGRHSYSRDCWSWAVIAIQCVTNQPLRTFPDLDAALVSCAGDTTIPADILRTALLKDPSARYQSASELDAALHADERSRAQESALTFKVQVLLPPAAAKVALAHFRVASVDEANERIVDDLNVMCSVMFSGEDETMVLIGLSCEVHADMETESGGRLRVTQFRRIVPDHLNKLRDRAVEIPEAEFIVFAKDTPLARANVRQLIDIVDRRTTQIAERQAAQQHDKLLDTFAKSLNNKSAQLRHSDSTFRYVELHRHEGFVSVRLVDDFPDDEVPDSLVFQPRSGAAVILGFRKLVARRLTLAVQSGNPDFMPQQGSLSLNLHRERQSLRRQRRALDMVRSGKCAFPRLAEVLRDPVASRPPESSGRSFPELAPDKSKVLDLALGIHDMLVVEGPPGTGKTTLIAKVIEHYLANNPSARILLSSQTHTALDHVIKKLLGTGLESSIVRVGGQVDKIDPAVHHLLLPVRLQAWLLLAEERSMQFMQNLAAQNDLDADHIIACLAGVERHALLHDIAKVEAELITLAETEEKETRERLERLSEGNPLSPDSVSERTTELVDERMALEIRLAALRKAEKRLRDTMGSRSHWGREFATASREDLEEWLRDTMPTGENAFHVRTVIGLGRDWLARLGTARDFEGAVLAEARIVAGTCVGLSSLPSFWTDVFDLCIVDEASKATATETLIPLSRAQHWLLVGDPKQLSPFIPITRMPFGQEQEPPEPVLTLLDHMIEKLPESCLASLTEQHRMCAGIGDLISELFYKRKLKSTRQDTERDALVKRYLPKPVRWISTAKHQGCAESAVKDSGGKSRGRIFNATEVRIVMDLLGDLNRGMKKRDKQLEVAVIAGYAEQVHRLDVQISTARQELGHLAITCDTVHAFQGKECDVAIYSVTRSNNFNRLGFQSEKEMLNVALSRARDALIVVGNANFCRECEGINPFRGLLEYIDSHNTSCELVDYELSRSIR